MRPDDMGLGLKSCVGVYLLELIRIILQYKWGALPSGVVLEDGGAHEEKWKRRVDERD